MNTILQQGSRDNAGRVYSGMRIPRFLSGNKAPQISSAMAMNRIVDTLNAFLRLSISSGTSDAVLISDSNVVIQKVPDDRPLAMLTASGKSPDLYWKFDESGSVTRVDSVISSALAVFTGTVPSTTGIINNAASFVTTGGFLGDGSLIISEGFTSGFSLSFWIKIIAASSLTESVGGVNFGNPTFQESIEFKFGAGIPSSFLVRFFSPDFTNTDLTLSIPDSAWHLITVSFNAATQGISAAIDNNSPTTATLGTAWVSATKMGHSIGTSAGQTLSFNMDEYAVFFNKVFNASDRSFLYNSGSPPAYPFSIP